MECLSPFKNLFLHDDDYIKLLKNLGFYLKEKLRFKEYIIEPHGGWKYPVMQLGDILVHFNHDTDSETAAEKWYRRCAKINMQNLFVEMYTESEEIARQFVELNQYAKKVCFVPFESNHKDMIQLELMPGQTEFWQAVNSSASNGNNALFYNPVDLLASRICCNRYVKVNA